MKPLYLHDGDPWILAEDIPDIDFLFSQIWLSSFVNDLEKTIGTNYKKVLSIYNGYNLKFYYGDKDSERISKVILDKIINEKLGVAINTNIKRLADELETLVVPITVDALHKYSNQELADLYHQLDEVHTEFYVWSWLPNAVDMFHGHFTEYLKQLISKKITDESEVNKALVALSFWEEKSFVQEEHESLLHLAILKKSKDPSYPQELEQHYKKYFYLKYLWVGKDGVATLEDYDTQVDALIFEKNPVEVLKSEEEKWQSDKILKETYIKKLSLTVQEQLLFSVYAEFAFTKAYRRRVQLLWSYKMSFIVEEISKRLDLTTMETRFMVPQEIIFNLTIGKVEDVFKAILTERVKYCAYYAEKDLEIVAIGEEGKKFEDTISIITDINITELRGQVACIGKVRGKVKIVNSVSDISKVEEGDILVSIATNPDVVPAMKKAAAFVTEQGGITSHAAIVAREMNKPCIIGTKIATKVLKDGDMVEVDAEKGIIKILNHASQA